MTSAIAEFPYRKLRNAGEVELDTDDDEEEMVVLAGSRSCFGSKRVSTKKRFRLKTKRKFLLASLGRVMNRFRESEVRFGDLFAGNYLFTQVNPISKSCQGSAAAALF